MANDDEQVEKTPPLAGGQAEAPELKKMGSLAISEEKEGEERRLLLDEPNDSDIKAVKVASSNCMETTTKPNAQSQFVEVACKSSGKVRRFAAGTETSYALSLINRKLGFGAPAALHIESVKEGEEPVSFGPNSILVKYGSGWKLQTVTEEDEGAKQMPVISKPMILWYQQQRVGTRFHGWKMDHSSIVSIVFFSLEPNDFEVFNFFLQKFTDFHSARNSSSSSINLDYLGRIAIAFAFIFLLGGTLTLFLENLPKLILFVNSFY